jgi:hypothetical protein
MYLNFPQTERGIQMTVEEEIRAKLAAEHLTVYHMSLPADAVYPNVTYEILDTKQWRSETGELVMERVHVGLAAHGRSYAECSSVLAAVGAALHLKNMSFTPDHLEMDPDIIRMTIDCYLFAS